MVTTKIRQGLGCFVKSNSLILPPPPPHTFLLKIRKYFQDSYFGLRLFSFAERLLYNNRKRDVNMVVDIDST